MSGSRFDAVIHLAGLPRGSAAELARVNVGGTRNLVNAVETRRFVTASSCAVYGTPLTPDGTVSEDHSLLPVSDYGRSMLERELAVPRGVSLRLFNITGPGQGPGMLVPDLTRKLARIALGKDDGAIVTGPLHTERDYLDVSDAARAFLSAATAVGPPAAVNIGSGVCRSGHEVLKTLAAVMGISPRVLSENRPSGTPRIRADILRARTSLGFSPSVPFMESMEATARYWLTMEMD